MGHVSSIVGSLHCGITVHITIKGANPFFHAKNMANTLALSSNILKFVERRFLPPPVVSRGADWLIAADVAEGLIASVVLQGLPSDEIPHFRHILLQC